MLKNKHFILLALLLIFIFPGTFISAMEVNLPGLSPNPSIADYISYLFTFGISLAGILALISFTIGAVGLINPNPEAHSDAKDRMKSAGLGLILTFASFIIMQTIDLSLVRPSLTPLTDAVLPNLPKPPGVYFYNNTGCTGESFGPTTNGQDDPIPEGIGSVEVVNGTDSYGVILHQVADLDNSGQCGGLITGGCTAGGGAHAADVFTFNTSSVSSGDGVTFYSEPFGWDAGADAGYKQATSNTTADGLVFDYSGTSATPTYRNFCRSFADCQGSIKIKGHYLVVLYLANGTCQSFIDDVYSLWAEPLIPSMPGDITNIYVIPTK